MRRKILIAICVLFVAYIVGKAFFHTFKAATTPVWVKNLGDPVEVVIYEDSKYSLEYQLDYKYLVNDLLYAKRWTSEEVEELLQFIRIPPILDSEIVGGDDFSVEALELWLKRDHAITVIAERFRAGAPIDPDQRQILFDELMTGVYQEESFRYFSSSVAKTMYSGLVDSPGPNRDYILYIYQHPREFFGELGESVAENIKRQLKAKGVFVLEGEGHG